MKTVRCEPIRVAIYYNSNKTVGWKLIDDETNELLSDGPFLNPLKEEVKEKYGAVRFIEA